MTRPHNPYIVGKPVRGDSFFGRQSLLEWVEQELQNPHQNQAVLYGPRRIGKTSLLRHLETTLNPEHFAPVYFDLQDQTTRELNEVLTDMAEAAIEATEVVIPGLGGMNDKYFRQRFLPALEKALAPRRPVFLLDEFDVLDSSREEVLSDKAALKTLFPYIRQLLAKSDKTCFIFVLGRRAEHLSSDMQSFIKGSLSHPVWVLDEQETYPLIRQGQENGGLSLSDDILARIYHLTSGHPLLTQLLCSRLWERCIRKETTLPVEVTLEALTLTIPIALQAGDAPLTWWWEGFSPYEKVAASALAPVLLPEKPLTEPELLTHLKGISTRFQGHRLEELPEALEKGWILQRVAEGHLTFSVELQRQWIGRQHPLAKTKRQLDQVNPEAHARFERGRQLLNQGVVGPALEHFRSALELHPSHLQAMLRMGEAHLQNQQPREAVEILVRAWRMEPELAAPDLKQAELRLGTTLLEQGIVSDAREILAQLQSNFPDAPESVALEKAVEAHLSRLGASVLTTPGQTTPGSTTPVQPISPNAFSKPAAAEDAVEDAELSAMRYTVDRLFCAGTHIYGDYRRLDDGHALLPGLYYRFRLENTTLQKPVTLQIFCQLKGLGGQLWEQQARSLLQLSASNHPALARIQDGSYIEKDNLAFVITEAAEYTLAEPGAIATLRSHPRQALKALLHLAEALHILHGNGMVHRNLTPESVDVQVIEPWSQAEPAFQLRLARFEMSVLLSNLLRRVASAQRPIGREQLQHFFRQQGANTLLFLPPERLRQLLAVSGSSQETPVNSLELPSSDIYSLGMLAWHWLIGEPPQALLQQAFANGTLNLSAFDSLLREMRSLITRAMLPKVLETLLQAMLSEDPRSRPEATRVKRVLQENWTGLQEYLGAIPSPRTLLIATNPEEFGRELSRRGYLADPQNPESSPRRFLQHDASTEQGLSELFDFMQDDLRGASLTYSERGFSPYARRSDDAATAARYVVLGKQFAYFCSEFEERNHFSNRPATPLPQVLMSRFTLERFRLRLDEARHPCIALPALKPQARTSPQLSARALKDAPVWTAFLESVKPTVERTAWQLQVDDAMTWLLGAHQAQLDARVYAYERVEDDPRAGNFQTRKHINARFDQARDDERKHAHPLLNLYATPRTRPEMGEFFEQLQENDDVTELVCYPDQRNRPLLLQTEGVKVRFVRKLDSHTVLLEPGDKEARDIPERGWLAPRHDLLSRPQLQRQERALDELGHRVALVDQLQNPKAVARPFVGDDSPFKKLKGSAPEVIKGILGSTPFFALHGPPGTGKTTVAARALEALLMEDRSSRILVSAQSNFALDNLAERLLDRVNHLDLIAVRIFSPHAGDRVNDTMKQYSPEAQTGIRVKRIQAFCEERLRRREDSPEVLALIARWKEQCERSRVEIRDRLAKGANLVFATCNIAAPERVELASDLDAFDLVIVEEAAKAWPTELMVPLVRGRRWLLIGDHKQLPAFQRQDIIQLLERCKDTEEPTLSRIGEDRDKVVRIFDLFKGLFDTEIQRHKSTDLFRDPRARLDRQFRMAPAIGALVSNAFYEGTLETDSSTDKPHDRTAPAFLKGTSLLWLDTGDCDGNKERPMWSNPLEVKVVLELLKQLRPRYGRKEAAEKLGILAPYREQVEKLKLAIQGGEADTTALELVLPASLRETEASPHSTSVAHLVDRVSTVDAFQGREAEVIIISLTRFNDINPETNIRRRLGHMAAPERLNVMMSRAKRLLILVGGFDFFEKSGQALQEQEKLPHWNEICKAVTLSGKRVSARTFLNGLESSRKSVPSRSGDNK